QPLVASALALKDRGHETVFLGDENVSRTLRPLGVEARTLPHEHDLGPHLIGAIREAMQATGGDMAAAGPIVQERMATWARDVALGIWEAPDEHPRYLDDEGDPWVLVTISSQAQDDIPLAQAALRALADRPVRVVLTVGGDHSPDEVEAVPPNATIERTVPH